MRHVAILADVFIERFDNLMPN